MAATGKVIGTVTAVVGEAKATAADGTVRILQVGDQVRSDEAISTSAAGSINVALESGKTLDCGGDVSLTLHESILGVATVASASTATPASDVDAIQRAIAAGQDPSQVASATAAGGAPAAGGVDDGGAHEPVILEQGNSASVVSSGFTTEGETVSFPTGQVQAQLMVASVSLPSSAHNEVPAALSVEVPSAPSFSAPADDQPIVSAVAIELAQAPATPAVEVASTPAAESNDAPQIVVSAPVETPVEQNPSVEESSAPVALNPDPVVASEDAPAQEPVIVVADTSTDEDTGDSEQPLVVLTQPEENPVDTSNDDESPSIPAADPEPQEQTDEGSQPPVVVVTQPEEETPAPTDSTPAEVPQPPVIANDSLTYSISANTNQDEQIAMLTLENGENTFQTLVLFGQEGQQKPAAVPLGFEITEDTSIVKLQYIDAFAGNSDANTGHTSQKIAIKDFALGIDGVDAVLAQENDGVNVGVGKSIGLEASVELDMTTGAAGEWSFGQPEASSNIDILDVTANTLDLGDLSGLQIESVEVISLKGSNTQELTLAAEDVLNATGSNTLHIMGGKEDMLTLVDDGQWTIVDGDSSAAGIQPSYFGWVQVTHSTGATLLVDPDVNVHLLG